MPATVAVPPPDADTAPRRGSDPSRKRRIRLVVALTAALLLAGALIYTSFSAASDEVTAGQLLAAPPTNRTYQLAGTVAAGVRRQGNVLWFRIRDPTRPVSALVRYTGIVPDPFRVGRGVIVKVRQGQGGVFIGERDSLITRCPSKFQVRKK